ncbi:MAG: dethiobiotin synthase [Bacteroidetes bacterium]|nr:dethiobiotin synthase [Bacteroidota bacterium]
MKNYFVTGIGTGVGKTVVSAIFTESLEADYWKPIQAGGLEHTDTDIVKNLISNTKSKFHPETYRLKHPASPHYSAFLENIKIQESNIIKPKTNNNLIIEGAGGLMVPLNNNFMIVDLIKQLNAEVVLVSGNYLGSINHTLLSVEALKNRSVPIKGIVFCGEINEASEDFILKYTGLPFILRVGYENLFSKTVIRKYADILYPFLKDLR